MHQSPEGALETGRPAQGAEAEGQSLDRAHRGPEGFGHTAHPARMAAGGQHHRAGVETPSPPEGHPGDAGGVGRDFGSLVLHEGDGPGPAGGEQGVHHLAVVHLVVVGQLHPGPDTGSQEGLGGAALR